MTRFFLAAGVAALAITAQAGAKPGGGGGGGHGAGNGDGNKGQAVRVERGGGGFKAAAVGHGGGQRFAMQAHGGGGGKSHAWKAEGHTVRAAKVDHVNRHEQRIANRIDRRDVVRSRDLRVENGFNPQFGKHGQYRGLAEGCPPGLWKKNNGCMPPGQLKNSLVGRLIPTAYRNGLVPLALRGLYADTPDYYYRYGDGYMYRVNRTNNLVDSLLPLLGGGYMPGQMFPSSYMNSYVPSYYQPFYPDTSDNYYRYANGNVYGIDPYTGMIDNVIPMYANGYGYGQMLPASYSAYNVPYQYRSLYYDTPDSYYRYAPGAIYQVDPGTSLITAVASLLTGNGLSVGQRLPMGYGAYNVPLAYRDQYYDTPDAWYRYNNGYIYQVDPATQVVTSLIRAIV